MEFAKFVGAIFLQNTNGRLLLIIAVSKVVKGELANKTVNYDTKTKAYVTNLSPKCKLLKRAVRKSKNRFQKQSFTDLN